MKVKSILLPIIALVVTATAYAQAKPEDLIRIRQASFRVIGWHCSRVKTLLEGQYDKEEVLAASTVIQSVANAGLNPFFAPGTDKGIGFHDSKAKPEAVDPAQAAKLAEAITGFRKDANELVKVAATGDKEATRTQFGNLTRHCKSCHDDFRVQ
jgi:cytochrome c556